MLHVSRCKCHVAWFVASCHLHVVCCMQYVASRMLSCCISHAARRTAPHQCCKLLAAHDAPWDSSFGRRSPRLRPTPSACAPPHATRRRALPTQRAAPLQWWHLMLSVVAYTRHLVWCARVVTVCDCPIPSTRLTRAAVVSATNNCGEATLKPTRLPALEPLRSVPGYSTCCASKSHFTPHTQHSLHSAVRCGAVRCGAVRFLLPCCRQRLRRSLQDAPKQ